MRLGLGIGLTQGGGSKSKGPFCEAIAQMVCVTAVYKGKDIRLEPHVVYGTGDYLLLDAVVVEYEGKKPNKPKLETFVTSNIKSPVFSSRPFTHCPEFNPDYPKYAGKIVCIIQVV